MIIAERPDVLISDVGIPGEDSHGMMRSLRASDGPTSRASAAALTAYARPVDCEWAMAVGCKPYLIKAVEVADSADAVFRLSRNVPWSV